MRNHDGDLRHMEEEKPEHNRDNMVERGERRKKESENKNR